MTNEAPGKCLPYSLMKEREREKALQMCECERKRGMREKGWENDKVNVSFDCRINCACLG